MKKFFLIALTAVLVFISCGNGNSSADRQVSSDSLLTKLRASHEFMEKYQMIRINPDTKEVKIHFMETESPFFDVFVICNKSRSVDVGFFRADDVTSDGRVKTGKSLIRIFSIFVPQEEEIESWGNGGITLLRADGTKHKVKFVPVDQPE